LANEVEEQSDARQALDRPFGLALSHLLGLGDRRLSDLQCSVTAVAMNTNRNRDQKWRRKL